MSKTNIIANSSATLNENIIPLKTQLAYKEIRASKSRLVLTYILYCVYWSIK